MFRINPQREPDPITPAMELLLHITNGNPIHDAKFKFEFQAGDTTRVWLVKLPRLQNPDAFAQRSDEHHWRLHLAVIGSTQPLEVQQYSQESVAQWLNNLFEGPPPGATELLILAYDRTFTVSIYQPS
jgi:hypothetical protein